MIHIDYASLTVGRQLLLDRIKFDLKPGELISIVGPNGAGKSTLARLLSGELHPTAGRVLMGGQDLQGQDQKGLARRRAVMTQADYLQFPMRVEEVVALGRYPYASLSTTVQNQQIVEWAMGRLDLSQFKGKIYTQLSGGERARVRLATALAQLGDEQDLTGKFLLLDEPLASLDLKHQRLVMDLLQQLKLQGLAVLLVVHDLNIATRYSDRVAVMQNGRLVACGDVSKIMTSQKLSRWFDTHINVQAIVNQDMPVILAYR